MLAKSRVADVEWEGHHKVCCLQTRNLTASLSTCWRMAFVSTAKSNDLMHSAMENLEALQDKLHEELTVTFRDVKLGCGQVELQSFDYNILSEPDNCPVKQTATNS
jgi:hypothetical protein